jgi:hypothetical protein
VLIGPLSPIPPFDAVPFGSPGTSAWECAGHITAAAAMASVTTTGRNINATALMKFVHAIPWRTTMALRRVGEVHGRFMVSDVIENSRVAGNECLVHSFHFGNDGLQMSQVEHERIKVRNARVFLPLSQ